MKLSNGIISVEIAPHGAELKSAVKDGFEYMWNADEKYWARTSPVLFPIVGALKNKEYTLDGKTYQMSQHGFARDNEFKLVESRENFASFVLEDNEETLKKYPFKFKLTINYTIDGNKIKIDWIVENKNDKVMSFSIGAHPGFNLKDGDNYFGFDTDKDIIFKQIDETGLFNKNKEYTLKNDGFVKIVNSMFDNDALIIENKQVSEVSLCDSEKKPYLKVKFDAEIFGLWSPIKMNAPFVCIEPWYGRCDSNDFSGDFSTKDYIINLDAGKSFDASYEIELL